MKRHVTTMTIEISAESIEARDFLAKTIADEINGRPHHVSYKGQTTARVIRARVSRSRPVRRAK